MREERTVWVEGRPCVIVLSDEREALLAAQAAGRAVVGVGSAQGQCPAHLPGPAAEMQVGDEAQADRPLHGRRRLPEGPLSE